MTIVFVIGVAATLAVFAMTIGSWNRSMIITAVFMGLAFIVGGWVATQNPHDATMICVALASAFLVYFCYMLGQLVTTLKEIAVQLQARK